MRKRGTRLRDAAADKVVHLGRVHEAVVAHAARAQHRRRQRAHVRARVEAEPMLRGPNVGDDTVAECRHVHAQLCAQLRFERAVRVAEIREHGCTLLVAVLFVQSLWKLRLLGLAVRLAA